MNAIETEDVRGVTATLVGDGEEINAANSGEPDCVDSREGNDVNVGNAGETGKKQRRARHKCPFPSCKGNVIHLPRHMRQVHDWNQSDSANVVGTFDLRKPGSSSSAIKKRKHQRKVCPKISCGAIVRRIHNHLAQVHNIKRGSDKLVKLVKRATKYEPVVLDCLVTSSDESSVESSDVDRCQDLLKMKDPNSTKVYDAVYDSQDSAEYDRILNDIVKGGGKKGGRDVYGRGCEGKCSSSGDGHLGDEDIGGGGHSGGDEEFESGNKNGGDQFNDQDNGGDEFVGGDSGGDDEFGVGVTGDDASHKGNKDSGTENVGGDSVNGGHESVGRESGDDGEFGGEVSDYGASHRNNEESGTENTGGDSVDGKDGNGNDGGDTATGKVSSNVDEKVILSNFNDWLTGPDGGRKDQKSARQCMRQVEMVMGYITPAAPAISSLLDKAVLRDNWLSRFEKEKRPGTVKSYLGALNNFYVYLRAECQHEIKELDVSEALLVSLSEQVKLWARSSRKMAQDRFWEKRVEDIDSLKRPEQITLFDTSDVARKA